MRKTLLLIALPALLLWSCNKDENPFTGEATVESTMRQGTWSVELLQDQGNYVTNLFKGRRFVFRQDGSATCTDSLGQTVNGSWSIAPQGDTQVKMTFGSASPENRLNRTFRVRDFGNNSFRLYTAGAVNNATYVSFGR